MSELEPIFADPNNWLDTLPPFQRQSIDALLASGKTYEEVAQLWLTTPGPANTFPFGGERFASVFYDKFMGELERFVCDDESYSDDRHGLLEKLDAGKALWIAAMATALAPRLG